MAPYKNGISQKQLLTKMEDYIIGFLKYYQHPDNKTYPCD